MARRRQRVRSKRGPMINSAPSRTIRPSGAIHPSKHRGVYYRVALRADPLTAPQHEVTSSRGERASRLHSIRSGIRSQQRVGCKRSAMPLDTDKIDDAALALLYLTLHDRYRAWKGFDWDVLDRLHDKGMIHDPVGKVKSVVFTPEGLERAKELFETMFKK